MPIPARLRRIRAAAAAWEAATTVDQETGTDGSVRLFRRVGQARAWIDWRADDGPLLIRIESFASPHGSRLLRLITRICDQFGVPMHAVPAPYNPRSEKAPPPIKRDNLLDWYRRHGFAILSESSVLYDGLRRYRRRLAAATDPAPTLTRR
jgi:hypothetical protein